MVKPVKYATLLTLVQFEGFFVRYSQTVYNDWFVWVRVPIVYVGFCQPTHQRLSKFSVPKASIFPSKKAEM